MFFIDTQSKTSVGRPVPTTTSNTATPQKYVLMSQRPIATQVNSLHSTLNFFINEFFFRIHQIKLFTFLSKI